MDVATKFSRNLARYEAYCMTVDDVDAWVHETRHKVMYRDEAKVD
jgi:hypothetical protein